MNAEELYNKIEPDLSKISVIDNHLNELGEAYLKSCKREDQYVGKYITDFEKQLTENLQKTIISQNSEVQNKTIALVNKVEKLVEESCRKNEELYEKTDSAKSSIYSLKFDLKEELGKKLDVSGIKQELTSSIDGAMDKAVDKKLEPVIKKLDKSSDYYFKAGKTIFENRDNYLSKKYVRTFYITWAATFFLTAILSLGSYRLIENVICENVFDKFYSDRYEKEISEPLKTAKVEAEAFLKQQKKDGELYSSERKKEADTYLKEKKLEADKYLEEQLAEARKKAQEEFYKRMDLYSQQVHKEVDKSQKKSKNKEQ